MDKEEFTNICHQAIAKAKRLKPDTPPIGFSEEFKAYGLDSLDIMVFLLELEQTTGLSFGDIDPGEVNTIEKLYAHV